jgi:hypothetical protein
VCQTQPSRRNQEMATTQHMAQSNTRDPVSPEEILPDTILPDCNNLSAAAAYLVRPR